MSLQKVAKGAFFLYIGSIVCRALGYVYWFVISRISGPEIIGLASTTVSLSILILTISYLDIPTGVQRFLGKAIGKKDTDLIKSYFRVELTMVGLTTLIAVVSLLLLSGELSALIGLPKEYIFIVAFMIITSGLVMSFRSFYISTMRTKELLMADIAGSTIRLPVGIILVLFGLGGLGAALGHFTLNLVVLVVLAILFINIIGMPNMPKLNELRTKGAEIVKAGMAIWPSGVLTVLGPQLGVIVVYGSQGAIEAGLYYIAQAIMMLIFAIPSSVMTLMFPLLSGMSDNRKRTTWKVMKISFAISTPIIIISILYSQIILGFLGEEFMQANITLIILLLSIVPSIIVSSISNLSYAYGFYRKVLTIALAASTPRVILYLFLTPRFGGIGAAEAFLIGSIFSFLIAYPISHTLGLKILWKDVIKLVFIPAIVGLIMYLLKLHWTIGSLLIIMISLLTFIKLKLITKRDLNELAKILLPRKLVKIGADKLGWVLSMLYGE